MNPDDESTRGRKSPRKYTQDRKKTSSKNRINTQEGTSQSIGESSGLRSFIDCMGECCLRNINVAKSFIFHNEDDENVMFRNGRAIVPGRTNTLPFLRLLDNQSNKNSSKDSLSMNVEYSSNGESSRNHKGFTLSSIWASRDDFRQDGIIEEVKKFRIFLNDYTEEIQMSDINLQNDKETQNFLEEKESIVLKHGTNKNILHDIEPVLLSAKKKSSILDNVPKMETIQEGKQFSSFPVDHLSNSNSRYHLPVESVDFEDIRILKSSDTIPMFHCNSWNKSGTSFQVKVEEKIWAENMTDVSDEILLEALKKLHEPTKNLWMATIGDADGLRRALSKGVSLDDVDYLGRTVLHLAVESGSTRAVRILLDNGLDPNAEDGMGRTSLYYATLRRPSLPIARLLFEYGAKIPKRKCPTDIGLFLELIIMSRPTPEEEQLMKLLVHKGARLEDANAPGGRQALHFAAMNNNLELIRALSHLGADINVTNREGMTPSDVAVLYECREAQFCLEDISISNILVDNRSSYQSVQFKQDQ